MTSPYTPPTAERPAPKWARKRFVLPALGVAFFIGAQVGGSNEPINDAKPPATRPSSAVTETVTASPEPAPTVTETEEVEVEVEVTETVTEQPAGGSGSGGGYASSNDSGSAAYYKNCAAARAAGAAPVRVGDRGYGRHLDRDGDGIGCEWG